MPRKRKKKIRFHLEEKQNREESQNEAVRKRNQCNKRNMMKRYQMYGATVSKLTEKSQNDTKKGEKK